MQPTVPSAAAALAPPQRRRGVLVAAALVVIAGVAGGLVLVLLAAARITDGVKGLARAPIGCATTLEFTSAGTFVVFIETKGEVGELRGDCPNAGQSYDSTGADLPDVTIVLVDATGSEVELDRNRSKSYDDSGFRGESIATIDIPATGSYVLTASSSEAEVAVTVGKDPAAGADSLRVGGFIAMGAGVLVGLVMLLIGLRRVSPVPPPAMPPAPPPGAGYDVYTPTMPPTVPPPPPSPPSVPPPPAPPAPPAPPPAPTQVLPPQPPGQWPSSSA